MSAGYRADLETFRTADPEVITHRLASFVGKRHGEVRYEQNEAWIEQTRILQEAAARLLNLRPGASKWSFLLEYSIPRRERRIDAVILAEGSVLITEFKVGAELFDSCSKWQTYDYALDIRDFHYASRGRPIFPVLVATSATQSLLSEHLSCILGVVPLTCATPSALAAVALEAADCADRLGCTSIDSGQWELSPYLPTLTIIEAAEEIFAGHQVREIAHATAENLTTTTATIINIIRRARAEHKRILCVVTGVPGAGKTLAGLSAVHDPALRKSTGPSAVFLSGNGPLVRVVRRALVLDAGNRGTATRETKRQAETFIQSIHRFLEAHGPVDGGVPPENVVVFDEAQRAWSAEQMLRKSKSLRGGNKPDLSGISEPERLLQSMERCAEWCVVVALVGGGQEINTGEAGLSEWGRAISRREVSWEIVASPEALRGGASVAQQKLFMEAPRPQHRSYEEPSLHLRTNLRSLRSQIVSSWVNAVIEGDPTVARSNMMNTLEFPVGLTRDLQRARTWLKEQCTDRVGSGLYGLVASSGALRLRAYGIEVSSEFRRGIAYEDWFLRERADVRSSQMLEVAATEFECQGLELDWVGICWGDDVTRAEGSAGWELRRFRSDKWTKVNQLDRRQFILNKYRVLMTRARKGFIIWVPRGAQDDPTRDPSRLDRTAAFLLECGIPNLD